MPLDWEGVRAAMFNATVKDFLADGVTRADPFIRVLRTQQRLTRGTGPQLQWTAITRLPTTYNIRGFDIFDTAQPDMFQRVFLDWKQKVVPLPIDRITELVARNAGENEIFDFISASLENCRSALGEALATGLYSDGSDPKEIDGLQLAINNTGTYAGVTRGAGTPWWNSRLVVNAASAEPTVALFIDYITSLEMGDVRPDLIITTRKIYNKIHVEALQNMRYDQGDEVTLGWEFIRVVPYVRLTWSPFVPTGTAFFLCTKWIKLETLGDFEIEERFPTNQAAKIFLVFWEGNLAVLNPVYQGRVTNLAE
jgi:hypothetical protein